MKHRKSVDQDLKSKKSCKSQSKNKKIIIKKNQKVTNHNKNKIVLKSSLKKPLKSNNNQFKTNKIIRSVSYCLPSNI